MHSKVHEVIRNVESRRTAVTRVIKILLAACEWTRVDRPALSQEDQSVKQGDNIGAWLMDGEDHCAIVGLCQGDETFDHVECIECVLGRVLAASDTPNK